MKTSSNTRAIPQRWLAGVSGLLAGAALIALTAVGEARAQKEIEIGIGTQNTTSNTVTGGIVIKELGLLEKYLPRTGQYKDVKFKIDWQNFTSGPPITNGMMANKIHIGMMGDYPLLVNGATGQQTRNETLLVAIIAYNQYGGGNGMVVHKDSPYYELADLKGKNVSVPFGSAAHGMLMQAMQSRGWPENFWNLASQSPEVGTTNLQEKRIDGHANFVPFMELLPYRGFARKIFDGAETRVPTSHGIVVRKDFAQNHPDIVVAYLLDRLEELGVADNTIVVLCGDNGAEDHLAGRGTGGFFDGSYFSSAEGGIRTPLLIRWPGRVKTGVESNEMVHVTDMFTTLLSFAGCKTPDDRLIDGVDQSPFFFGDQQTSNREACMVWLKDELHAVKWKDFKINFRRQQHFHDPELPLGFARITHLQEDPKEREPVNQRYVRWWVMQHAQRAVRAFEDSTKVEELIPPGAPLDFVPKRTATGA